MYKTKEQDIGYTYSSSFKEYPPSLEGGSTSRSDPEVMPKKKRRYYTASYKLRILEEVDNFTEQGQLGALLRREGLYYSSISRWRRQREQGQLQGLSQKRGRKKSKNEQEQKRIQELERENARLRNELKKAETVIEFQKKSQRSWTFTKIQIKRTGRADESGPRTRSSHQKSEKSL